MAIDDAAKAIKTVIVKGLGKIKFPASMADDEIAGIIKRHADLDMSEPARMARAKATGYAIDDPLFTGSHEAISEIRPEGVFDGIFASKNKTSASSHGDTLNTFFARDGKILTQPDIDYEIPYEDQIKALKKSAPWLDDADMETAYKAVFEDKSHKIDSDELMRIMRTDDAGEASWEAQRLRGKVANDLGYDAVAMSDEHGTSYLLPHGTKARKSTAAFNPELAFSDNILASAAPVTAGLGLGALMLTSPKSQANEQRAISRLSEMGQSRPTGTIQAAQNPLLGRAANALLSFQTPLDPLTGPQFQNTANLLQKFNYGDKRSYWDYFNANLDWM